MRKRLLLLTVGSISALLLTLMVPLLTSQAGSATRDVYLERLSDTTRFAVVAADAMRAGNLRPLQDEIDRYDEVYGVEVIVTDSDARVVAASRSGADATTRELTDTVSNGLAGRTPDLPETAWPWRTGPMVVAMPIGRDAQTFGTVVTVSPTDDLRGAIALRLAGLAGLVLVMLVAVGIGVAVPLVRWILRPVDDLDDATHQLARGSVPIHVTEHGGPVELQRLAASFNIMADSVAASQDQQRKLVADASHQLGSPLTALRLRVEQLAPHVDADARSDLDHLAEETDRLSDIVGSLLRLTQVGAVDSVVESRRVGEQAARRAEIWRPVFANLRVSIDESVRARATADTVDVALDAMLDNASKFGGDDSVDVSLYAGDGAAVLSVRDYGDGLDDGIDRIGERFFRSARHQNVEGTGLGLAIVRALVEHAGGRLRVRAADPGLEVSVVLVAIDESPGSSAPLRDADRAAR